MSEEKKNAKLNEEELEKVSGGGFTLWGQGGESTTGPDIGAGECSYYINKVCSFPGGESQCPFVSQGRSCTGGNNGSVSGNNGENQHPTIRY